MNPKTQFYCCRTTAPTLLATLSTAMVCVPGQAVMLPATLGSSSLCISAGKMLHNLIILFTNLTTSCHILDAKSTAQTKVQIQIVEQLKQQLNKEQSRMEGMRDHMKQVKEAKMINQQISADSPQLSPQLPQLSSLSFLSYSPSQKMSSQAGPVRKKVAERQSSMEGKRFLS